MFRILVWLNIEEYVSGSIPDIGNSSRVGAPPSDCNLPKSGTDSLVNCHRTAWLSPSIGSYHRKQWKEILSKFV